MKGAWVKNLLVLVLNGEVPIQDAITFGMARLRPKPVSFTFEQIYYENVDHNYWGILADILVNRVYSPQKMEIKDGDIVVDIGAHRGGFSTFAARRTSNSIFAFEPDPLNFSLLQQHITKNNMYNIVAKNAAIGAKTGKSQLFKSSISSRHSIRGLDAGIGDPLIDGIEVETLSLDDCLSEMKKVDFLKMDCEGAEIDIISYASTSTLSKINKMVVETHDPVDSAQIEIIYNSLSKVFQYVKLIQQDKQVFGYLLAYN